MSDERRYALGVDLGTTYTCAAVADQTGPARVAQLSGTSQTIPSVVSIGDDSVFAGEAAERRLVSHPGDTAREFKRRFGDPAPIVLAGDTYGADQLTGHLLAEVIERVARNEGSRPSTVALAHPAAWGPFRLDLLRDAATQAGVDDVVLIPEPVAAAVANRDRVEDGSLVAVYDIGGGTFDAAVVRCDGDWSVVGTPEGVERLGGIDFDQAIMAHVDATLDGQVFQLDSSDPDARSALMQLRAECQSAKEHLSQDTDVEIPVSLPNLRTSVRLTRDEFESMVRPRLADSLAVFDRVVASAGATWDDISAVLLVGGSSNIPAVGQLVAEHTGRPIVTATNPHLAIAAGTATVAAEQLTPPAIAEPAPAPAATPATAAVASSASAGCSDGPAAAKPAEAPSRRWLPIVVVIAALAVAAAAFFVITGGDDSEPTDSTEQAADPTQPPSDTAPADTATADTAPPVSEPSGDGVAASGVDVGIESCGAGDLAVLAVLEFSGSLVAIDDAVASLDSATIDPCSIDVADRTPTGNVVLPGPPIGAASSGDALAIATVNGGVVANGGTGNIVDCQFLTGPLAVNDQGVVFPIVDGTVERIRATPTDCSQQDNSALSGIAATAVGVAADDRLAIGGEVDAAVELWVFVGEDDRNVVGGSGADLPGGFGSIDGIVLCDGSWCVIDLDRQVVHIVDLMGEYVGATDLVGSPLDGATDIVASGNTGSGPALVTADVGGARQVVRLTLP